jgi:hypothetical protein
MLDSEPSCPDLKKPSRPTSKCTPKTLDTLIRLLLKIGDLLTWYLPRRTWMVRYNLTLRRRTPRNVKLSARQLRTPTSGRDSQVSSKKETLLWGKRVLAALVSWTRRFQKIPPWCCRVRPTLHPCAEDRLILISYLLVLWGSIGWSVGATLGAALAAREQGRRTCLFVGDGSLQLTVQEVCHAVVLVSRSCISIDFCHLDRHHDPPRP